MFKETTGSKRQHHDEYWAPEDILFAFTAWLKCGHPGCGEEVVVSGRGGVEEWQTANEEGEPEISASNYFSPRYFSHTPDIFDIPTKCPGEVAGHLRAGFRLFFLDQGAAANRLRVALESLLNHLSVPRRRRDQNNNLSDLSLHKRIELFMRRETALGRGLMALKWLGNTASHEGSVRRDDLLDAFEIFEHSLVELIEQRSARVAELARKLTKKHAKR